MNYKFRIRKKTSLEIVLLQIAVFCITSFALLEHASISIVEVSAIKMPLLYMGGFCLLSHLGSYIRKLKKKSCAYTVVVLFALCILLFLSARANKVPMIGTSPMKTTIRLILYLMELFFLMMWVCEAGWCQQMLNFLFRYVLILTIATDVLLFTRWIVFADGDFESFLVGTKFNVAYFHMDLLTLWFMRNRNRFYSNRRARRIIIIGIPVVIFVSVYVDCMTGVLGCLVLLILFFLVDSLGKKKLLYLNSPVVLLFCMIVSTVFPFIAEQIVSIPSVAYIIENVLGRNSSLTGRMNIFETFGSRMQAHWSWGFGYGNGNAASMSLFGYANAQNALLNWILQTGIPATIILAALILVVFHYLTKSSAISKSMPLVLLVYLYTILGAVEITYGMSFLLWIALIFMFTIEKKPVKQTEPTGDEAITA